MADISVIIPVYRDDAELAGLLSNLQHSSIHEIIIVDGEDRPLPAHIANHSEQNIVWKTSKRGRGAQIAAGISIATHENIWVLHADCRPAQGSVSEILRLLKKPTTSLACFPLSFRTSSLELSLFAALSKIDSPFTTFGDQGYAFRKADYDRLDIDLSSFPLLEDVALRAAFCRIGRVRKARVTLPTSARRFESLGVWRTQLRNVGILFSYWRGTSPKTLHAQYYNTTRKTAPMSQPSWIERQASTQVRLAARRTENDSPAATHPRLPARL